MSRARLVQAVGRTARKVRVDRLKGGDFVDLEGDRFADPDGSSPCFQMQYKMVMEVVRETPGCVCVHFDGFSCGFPPDHELEVVP